MNINENVGDSSDTQLFLLKLPYLILTFTNVYALPGILTLLIVLAIIFDPITPGTDLNVMRIISHYWVYLLSLFAALCSFRLFRYIWLEKNWYDTETFQKSLPPSLAWILGIMLLLPCILVCFGLLRFTLEYLGV